MIRGPPLVAGLWQIVAVGISFVEWTRKHSRVLVECFGRRLLPFLRTPIFIVIFPFPVVPTIGPCDLTALANKSTILDPWCFRTILTTLTGIGAVGFGFVLSWTVLSLVVWGFWCFCLCNRGDGPSLLVVDREGVGLCLCPGRSQGCPMCFHGRALLIGCLP